MDDAGLQAAVGATTIFARVTPEQKARVIARGAARRGDGRLPRRRRQRRGRAARRRRRHLGRGRDRRRARTPPTSCCSTKTSACSPTGIVRGPAHLRQHDQVRADGDLVELREHVQRRRRVAVPVVPADAADADPAQQPPLRRRQLTIPTDHVDEELLAAPGALGHRPDPPLHASVRADHLGCSTSSPSA